MEDKDFLETIVKAIVDRPEDVVVDRTIDERGVLLTLKVHPEEMGKVIGKQGQTARSLRTLLRIIGNKNNSYVNLKVYEPDKDGHGTSTKPYEKKTESQDAPRVERPALDEEVDDLKL